MTPEEQAEYDALPWQRKSWYDSDRLRTKSHTWPDAQKHRDAIEYALNVCFSCGSSKGCNPLCPERAQ